MHLCFSCSIYFIDLLCSSLKSFSREEKSMACDVALYVENMGLTRRGIDVLSLTKKDVPTFHIEELFGPKISINTKIFN